MFPLNVKDAIAVVRAVLSVGKVVVAGIITISVATVPGVLVPLVFDQFEVTFHAVLVVPVHV